MIDKLKLYATFTQTVIGVNLSEPHTSELNSGIFMYIYAALLYVFCMSVQTVI